MAKAREQGDKAADGKTDASETKKPETPSKKKVSPKEEEKRVRWVKKGYGVEGTSKGTRGGAS